MGRTNRRYAGITPKRKTTRDPVKRRQAAATYKEYESYIRGALGTIQKLITDGAVKYKQPLSDVRARIFGGSKSARFLRKVPKNRVYQAYVHHKAKLLNADGEKKKLREIQDIVANETPHYTTATKAEKDAWIHELEQDKAQANTQKRANRKGEAMDAAYVYKGIGTEMDGLHLRTGVEQFYMAARSDALQTIKPTFICNDKTVEFFTYVLGKTPAHVVRLFEMWTVNGLKGVLGPQKKSMNDYKHEVRRLINIGLCQKVAPDGDYDTAPVEMNYASYETAIVAKHGVKLAGWPLSAPWAKVCNPGDITRIDALRALHTALLDKTCYWADVEDGEREAIEPVERPPRADKGVARGPYKKRSLAIRNADESENDEDEAADTSAAPPTKKAKASTSGTKSAATAKGAATKAKGAAAKAKAKGVAAKVKGPAAKGHGAAGKAKGPAAKGQGTAAKAKGPAAQDQGTAAQDQGAATAV